MRSEGRGRVLLRLFISTLYLSAFTFGGGYVIVTLLKRKFVDELHWIDEEEMLDMVAIAQSSPGAIAVNGAIVVGYKLAGFPGILCAIFGAVIPPFALLTLISHFYGEFRENFVVQALLTGMTAGVGAVILSVVFDMAAGVIRGRNPALILSMLIAFAAACFFQVNVIYIILAAIAAGLFSALICGRGREDKKDA